MIKLVDSLPDIDSVSAELVKIKCLYDCYKNDSSVLFWVQDGFRAIVSMADGNMTVFNNGANTDELSEFVNVMSPDSIFSNYDTLSAIGKKPCEKVYVMYRLADTVGTTDGDELSSKEIYDLLDVKGLSLPEYPYFAVDYCRRFNHGGAEYFGIKDKCIAVTFGYEKYALLNGIASHRKGYGTVALNAILQKNYGRKFLVCCRDNVKDFYIKNGFKELYYAGYWVK